MNNANFELWGAVDRYMEYNMHPPSKDAVLIETLKSNQANSLPDIDVSPAHGKMLTFLAKLANAKHIAEFGLLGGYSTICLVRGLSSEGGKVTTFEIDEHHAAVARKNLINAGVADSVDIHIGPALDSIKEIDEQGGVKEKFDLIFIDADKENNTAYVQWTLKYARPGAVVVVDNMIRNGRVVDPYHPVAAVQGCRQLVDFISKSDKLEGFCLQTVGCKGYDGFVIATVK